MAGRSAAAGSAPSENGGWSRFGVSLGERLVAYLIDSIFLFGFTALFATLAGLSILISSDFGEESPSDGAFLALVGILLAAMPTWLVLNYALLRLRSQTVGQYVVGLTLTREDGGREIKSRLGLYLVALHPLVFHPIFAVFWALVAVESVVLASSTVLLLLALVLAILCLLGPIANLVFAIFDSSRRGIHDRVAGLMLQRLP